MHVSHDGTCTLVGYVTLAYDLLQFGINLFSAAFVDHAKTYDGFPGSIFYHQRPFREGNGFAMAFIPCRRRRKMDFNCGRHFCLSSHQFLKTISQNVTR